MNESSSTLVYSLFVDFFSSYSFFLFIYLFIYLVIYLFISLFILFIFFSSSKKDYLLLFFPLLSSVRSHGVGAASEILVLVTPVRIWVWPLFWQLKVTLVFFSQIKQALGVQKYFSLWCCYYCWYKNKIFIFLFFIYLFVYLFVYLFNIKSGDGGHRSHCPFHAKEMLYHLSYIPFHLVLCVIVSWYNRHIVCLCLFVCLFICLFIYLYTCFIYLFIYLFTLFYLFSVLHCRIVM